MFNELINKVSEPVSVVFAGVKEGFAKCTMLLLDLDVILLL